MENSAGELENLLGAGKKKSKMNTPVNYSSLEEGNPFRDDDENEEGGVIIHQVPETKGSFLSNKQNLSYLFLFIFVSKFDIFYSNFRIESQMTSQWLRTLRIFYEMFY